MTWEYFTARVPEGADARAAVLAHLGKHRWELVAVSTVGEIMVAFFKRPEGSGLNTSAHDALVR